MRSFVIAALISSVFPQITQAGMLYDDPIGCYCELDPKPCGVLVSAEVLEAANERVKLALIGGPYYDAHAPGIGGRCPMLRAWAKINPDGGSASWAVAITINPSGTITVAGSDPKLSKKIKRQLRVRIAVGARGGWMHFTPSASGESGGFGCVRKSQRQYRSCGDDPSPL